MSLSVAIAGLLGGILVWFLLARRLTAKPWLTIDAQGAVGEGGPTLLPAATIGLLAFLAVVTSLFGLFITAFHMRIMNNLAECGGFKVPSLVWANTALLVLASGAMEWARLVANRGDAFAVLKPRLLAGGLLTLAFLLAQLLAWRQVYMARAFSPANPAIAFFFLLTFVHGLHLVGGLAVWVRTLRRVSAVSARTSDVRLTLNLCATYWHYLLLVWLVLFGFMLSI
jgi:cytochrome c oxidase subunit 3